MSCSAAPKMSHATASAKQTPSLPCSVQVGCMRQWLAVLSARPCWIRHRTPLRRRTLDLYPACGSRSAFHPFPDFIMALLLANRLAHMVRSADRKKTCSLRPFFTSLVRHAHGNHCVLIAGRIASVMWSCTVLGAAAPNAPASSFASASICAFTFPIRNSSAHRVHLPPPPCIIADSLRALRRWQRFLAASPRIHPLVSLIHAGRSSAPSSCSPSLDHDPWFTSLAFPVIHSLEGMYAI